MVAAAIVLALVPLEAGVAAASPAARAHVDGVYRIKSTDCYFPGGTCTAVFDIEQDGRHLYDTSDRHLRGRVRRSHVKIAEIYHDGVSEDSWGVVGTTQDGGLTISGTMWDGIGGQGTFTMKYLRP